MASASSNPSNTAARKPAKAKRQTPASRASAKALRSRSPAPRQLFIPGSLNDQLSKLDPGESFAKCKRIPLDNGNVAVLNNEAQKYFKAQNSILSGGIAKVRSASEHKSKRYKMERGTYMSASNDAMFAFLTVTRME